MSTRETNWIYVEDNMPPPHVCIFLARRMPGGYAEVVAGYLNHTTEASRWTLMTHQELQDVYAWRIYDTAPPPLRDSLPERVFRAYHAGAGSNDAIGAVWLAQDAEAAAISVPVVAQILRLADEECNTSAARRREDAILIADAYRRAAERVRSALDLLDTEPICAITPKDA